MIIMRKQLYLDIKSRLQSVTDEAGAPLFRHFDLWNRQVEFLEVETPFQRPAVFVEFDPMQWRTLGNRVQECTLTVRLHIVTEYSFETADYSPIESQSLEFLDIIVRVVATMQGFSTGYMNGWMRVRSVTNHDHETHVDSVEEYVCNLRDLSADRPMAAVQVAPNVTEGV
jgi:hypothetical protein